MELVICENPNSNVTVQIHTIRHTDEILESVIKLGKENSKTLGLFPRDAFIDCAKRKNIIVATDSGKLLGYLLFRVTQLTNTLHITHLCIDSNSRNKGVAESLMNFLKENYKYLVRGIALSCRSDYKEASAFWNKHGFIPKGRVRSRSKKENYLIKWYFDFEHADLFSLSFETSNKIKAQLDSSVLLKLSDNNISTGQDAKSLLADWLLDEVDYYYACEIYNEIHRDKNKVRANNTRTYLNNFSEVRSNKKYAGELSKELKLIIVGETDNDESDRNHLSECIAAGIAYFITYDKKILAASEIIFNKYDLRVISPIDFILSIDQFKNKSNYNSLRISGAKYTYTRVQSTEINTIASEFVSSTEKVHAFKQILIESCSDVKKSLFKVVKEHDGTYLGCFVCTEKDKELHVKVIRTKDGKISNVLFQQLVNDIISHAIDIQVECIIIYEQNLSSERKNGLSASGFVQSETGGYWYKIVCRGLFSINELLSLPAVKRFWSKVKIENSLSKYEQLQKPVYLINIERQVWPAKIKDIDIPTYIIPIKPHWAGQLFDYFISEQTLFGSNPRLLWSRENVYYRSVKPVLEKSPSRILWYVSSDADKATGRDKGIVACSYIDEVHIDTAFRLFQRFKNYGIYEWIDILKCAKYNENNEIKAIKFSDTEVFKKIIPLSIINRVFKKHKKSSNSFVSPMLINHEIFDDLYTTVIDNA